MSTNIRSANRDDYDAIADVYNAARPDNPVSGSELLFNDEHTDPKCFLQRWVTERDGVIVGTAIAGQWAGMYHPQKFFINGAVTPQYQRQGIGTALYDHLIDALQRFDPIAIRAQTREDHVGGAQFLRKRGFTEEMRAWESRLDVAAFDPSPYADLEARVRAHGIEIKTLRELEADPDRNRKVYDLYDELEQDVPHPDELTRVGYEVFAHSFFERPTLLPDANFIAVDGDEYVGTSALWLNEGDTANYLWTGLTGVRRAYRRKGIALALKLRGIAYARTHGHPVIVTDNESNNRPMLSINERLGYVKQPAWIGFVRLLNTDRDERPNRTPA